MPTATTVTRTSPSSVDSTPCQELKSIKLRMDSSVAVQSNCSQAPESTPRSVGLNHLLVGAVVIILFVLSYFGLR
jgi:cobalamin biosynthesis Mg chelatase CobN